MPDTSRLLRCAPCFPIADFERTTAHYEQILGFRREYDGGEPPHFAIMSRDGMTIMLRLVGAPYPSTPNEKQGGTWDAFFWVEDARALHAELSSKGATVVYGPIVQESYGMEEFGVRDCDGHVLGFGHVLAPPAGGASGTAGRADIVHAFPVHAAIDRVFHAFSTAEGLDSWWTKRATGIPSPGAEYTLGFGPGYEWRARVTRCVPNREFELRIVGADDEWIGTRVGVRLELRGADTWVSFYHMGWPRQNEHYRVSCMCWAMYLRILRRALEHDESVPYENRLDA